MAGTTVVEARKALVTLLQARPGLSGVHVSYEWDGGDRTARDAIWTAFEDDARTSSRVPVMWVGTGAAAERLEEYRLVCPVEVRSVHPNQQTVDERCVTLLKEIEETVAANPHLGIPNLIQFAALTGFRPVSGRDEQGGRSCRFETFVAVTAILN